MFKKDSLGISLLLLGVILTAGATALADNVRSLTLPADVVLQGTRLQAGEYTVTWYHHSPRLTVKVSNAEKTLVTASAQMVKRGRTYERNTLGVSTMPDGTKVLREIVFAGSSRAIVFDAQRESKTPFMLPSPAGGIGRTPGSSSRGAYKQMVH